MACCIFLGLLIGATLCTVRSVRRVLRRDKTDPLQWRLVAGGSGDQAVSNP